MERRDFLGSMIAAGLATVLPIGELWKPTKTIFIPKEVGIKRLSAVVTFPSGHQSVWPFCPESWHHAERPWTPELLNEMQFKLLIPGASETYVKKELQLRSIIQTESGSWYVAD